MSAHLKQPDHHFFDTLDPISHAETCRLFVVMRDPQETEERRLWARDRIIRSNLRFVVNTARYYASERVPFVEVVQEGCLGLVDAIDRFDPGRGQKFISYAVWWIKQKMRVLARQYPHTVATPLNPNMIKDYQPHRYVRLDGVVVDEQEESEISMHNLLVGEDGRQYEEEAIANDCRAKVRRLLATLPARDRQVLVLYFGLSDKEPLTLDQIGKILHLTRERIRQIKDRAFERLRVSMQEAHLEEELLRGLSE